MVFKDWLRALGKLEYVQGKTRPNIDCILCGIRDNDERVVTLKIYQDDIAFATLNLYPYNPAHMMVVPNRHITRYLDLTKKEILHVSRMIQGLMMMLDHIYSPHGYNVGINQGRPAGGSIEHLHVHVVPRYGSELGYIDIVGSTRIVPEGLEAVQKKISAVINDYLNEDFFENF